MHIDFISVFIGVTVVTLVWIINEFRNAPLIDEDDLK